MADSAIPAVPPHRRLFDLLRPERSDIWLIVLFSAIKGLLALATPLTVDAVVNNISFGGQQPVYVQSLIVLAGLLFAILLAYAAITAVQHWVVELLQQRIFVRLAGDFAYRLPRLQFDALERTRRPELVNKFLDVVTVQKSSVYLLLDGLNVVLATAIGLLVLAFYHPFLLAFDFFLVVALLVVLVPMGRNGVSTSVHESHEKHAVAGWLEQVVMFPVLFKSTAAAALSRAHTDKLVNAYISARRDHFRVLMRQILGLLGLEAMAGALLLVIGGMLVLRGQLTLGQLVAAELIVGAMVAALAGFAKSLENWYDTLAAVDKLGSVVDLPIERSGGQSPSTLEEESSVVEVVDLTFAYPGLRPLFQRLRFRIDAGEDVAITGPIGSGAGTLLELIYGLRTPTEGSVRVLGLDVRSWGLDALRSHVVLLREPEFVEGSLAENVGLGRSDLPPGAVQRALEAVGFGSTLDRFADGLEHRLRPGGRPLSDSQRILVAVARAIAARPSLLLIDKLLDGLDATELETVLDVLLGRGRSWRLAIATRDERVLRRFTRVVRLAAEPVPDEPSGRGRDWPTA